MSDRTNLEQVDLTREDEAIKEAAHPKYKSGDTSPEQERATALSNVERQQKTRELIGDKGMDLLNQLGRSVSPNLLNRNLEPIREYAKGLSPQGINALLITTRDILTDLSQEEPNLKPWQDEILRRADEVERQRQSLLAASATRSR